MRQAFTAELEQLRLQVELMGVRVDENLERMREVLHNGDVDLATTAVQADDPGAALAEIHPDSLTPRAALDLLYELKRMAED